MVRSKVRMCQIFIWTQVQDNRLRNLILSNLTLVWGELVVVCVEWSGTRGWAKVLAVGTMPGGVIWHTWDRLRSEHKLCAAGSNGCAWYTQLSAIHIDSYGCVCVMLCSVGRLIYSWLLWKWGKQGRLVWWRLVHTLASSLWDSFVLCGIGRPMCNIASCPTLSPELS